MTTESGRRILAVMDDLFFASKIRAAAQHIGAEVEFVKTAEAARQSAARDIPSLVIVDLQSQNAHLSDLARAMKDDARTSNIPLIGFFSHVQIDLKNRAAEVGFDRALPRSAFVARLTDILQGNF
ncbi:MAG TPA: hypothetical protein VM870_07245 [Pyrinomonadaceae bacterium]|jgi:PleD family two-component response regulator|nr:hypothetical protein [Pyrinomonadaceae bacterium]